MLAVPSRSAVAKTTSLEESAVAARACFACMFATSEEYEDDLIRERRASGHYRTSSVRREAAIFAGSLAILATLFIAAF